jgi:hypothetical protein
LGHHRQLNPNKLVTTDLQKSLLSPTEAFARTLKRHRMSLDRPQEQRRQALAASRGQLDLLQGGGSQRRKSRTPALLASQSGGHGVVALADES